MLFFPLTSICFICKCSECKCNVTFHMQASESQYGVSLQYSSLYSCTALQAFARLSAVFGGTYMLSKPDATVVYDSEGVVTGVKSVDEEGNPATAATKIVVGDPSTLCTATCYAHALYCYTLCIATCHVVPYALYCHTQVDVFTTTSVHDAIVLHH